LAALLMVAGVRFAIWGQTAAGTTGTVGLIPPEHSNVISRIDGASVDKGSIAGRLTDLRSAPLAGATVVVRNEATGATQRTITARNGSYRFQGLEAGEYTLEAENERLGTGRLDGIVVAAGHEARVQTAMELVPAEPKTNPVKDPVVERETPVESVASRVLTARTVLVAGPLRAGWAREAPEPSTPTVTVELAEEPLSKLTVSGRQIDQLALEMPAAIVQVFHAGDAALAAEAPQMGAQLALAPMQGMVLIGNALSPRQVTRAEVDARDMDPVSPAVTTTLDAEQVQGLPASGRHWQDFVLDTPTAVAGRGSGSQLSLRGSGQEPADTSVDGASTRLAFGGSGPGSQSATGGGAESSEMGQAWAGGRGTSPIAQSAIREVQTVAGNVEAEGARAASGRMNVETERGANGLHGQGFLFDRQNTWGAKNPFTQWVTETAQAALNYDQSTILSVPIFDNGPNGSPESYTPPDQETVWGLGVGRQIKRDKLFWFGALDSYRRNDQGVAMVKHPYVWQTPGDCQSNSPCAPTPGGFFATPDDCQMQVLSTRLGLAPPGPPGQQPTGCVSGLVQGLTAYSQMLQTLDGLLGPAPRTSAQWVGFGRMDWQTAERHRLTLEGIGATWDSPGGGLTGVSENFGSHSFGSSEASKEWLLGRWEAYLTPNLLAITQGSAGRNILSMRPETPSAYEQTLLGPNVYGQLPQIVVDNRYGFTIGNPSRFGQGSYPDERLYEGQEMVDWVRGSLLVKAGFDLSHNFDATSMLRNQTGTYTYSSVENFASDALVFAAFGTNGQLNPDNQHNCDQTGTVWTDPTGTVRGLGNLPCYSSFSQTIGPSNWYLSTNDWAGYVTTQWQPKRTLVLSAGLRWEMEQMPPPIPGLNNPQLPLTEKLPSLGNNWGPRVSLALGSAEGRWPVLRMGYGMYYGRTENSTIETALTQTGSRNGDMSFFLRPTDNLPNNGGGAPPFPYVLAGPPGSVVTPGAVEFSPNFHNPEVHQGLVGVEERLPGHVEVTASAMVSLGRRLPVPIDANLAAPTSTQTITYNVCDQAPTGPDNGRCGNLGLGPIKAAQITVPYYASWPSATVSKGDCITEGITPYIGWLNPCYQGINEIMSKANSTYEGVMVKVVRYGHRGLSLHAHYTYSHAMDWNPDESPLAPDLLSQGADFKEEYGTSNQDMRHSAAVMAVYEAPWKLHGLSGKLGNGWMLSGIGQFHSGLPYSMQTSGSLAKEFTSGGSLIAGLGPGMNGSGGASRVYGVGSNGVVYNIGRNTFRYPATWKADMRMGKSFDLGQMRKLELLVESFNLFNHQNVTEIETTGYSIQPGSPPSATGAAGTFPTLNFLTGLKISSTTGLPIPGFGQPLNVNATDFYRERQLQVGVRVRF